MNKSGKARIETAFRSDELRFIESHRALEPWMFMDAREMSPAERKVATDQNGKKFIIGVPCRAAGHRLRTKAGACIQCKPEKIAHQLRSSQPGIVYIAGSQSLGAIKIGSTNDVDDRIKQANAQSYGGTKDWELLFHVKVGAKGKIEDHIKQKLNTARIAATYFKNGREQQATEIFRVDFKTAQNAVAAAIQRLKIACDKTSAKTFENAKRF